MYNKLKITFWVILVIIIMNCGVVFASKATEGLDYVLNNESDFTSFMDTEEYTDVISILENYDNVVIYKYFSTVEYLYVYSTNGQFIKQANGQFKASEASNFIRIYRYSDSGLWTYRSTNSNTGQAFVPTEIIYTSDTIFDWEGNEVLPPTDTYKKPYYEITLDYKGQSSIQANGEKVKAYTYDSIYDTGITTIGNKFLKLGYLYIDDNYTISNLLTSIPIMTKYSMNLINNWEYTLFEGVYTTGEKENGFLKYEIRIPIEYVSTPNYYNIFFRSRDTKIQEDINIDFVLLNNTENSGTIVTPSGDIISGDYIKDETTLGDINNTINDLNNFLQNNNVSIESGDLTGIADDYNIDDPTYDFFTWLIEKIEEVFTTSGYKELKIKVFETEHIIKSNVIVMPDGVIKTFLQGAYWFSVGIYVLKDIRGTIDKFKNGNIEDIGKDDINADIV